MIDFELLNPRMTKDHLGYLPQFLDPTDQSSARDQLDRNYQHGGGWNPMKGWKLDPKTGVATFPGDPPQRPLAKANLRDETIYFYNHAWVSIVQSDGSFEIARMD